MSSLRIASTPIRRNPYSGRLPGAELVGVFKYQRQQWDDVRLIVLECNTTVKVSDPEQEMRPDLTYRFTGYWKTHPKYGKQFHADSFATDTPINERGIIIYLAQNCDNVGKVTARKLYDTFQQRTLDIVKDHPEKVAETGILTLEQAKEAAVYLKHDIDLQRSKIDLLGLFNGRGFGKRVIQKCVELWGARAADVVRRDPFTMMVQHIPSCGYKRCDGLYLALGLNPHRRKRHMLAGWYSLHSDSTGHTWFPMDRVKKVSKKALGLGERAKWLITREDETGKVWITEHSKAMAEKQIATSIHQLLEWKPRAGEVSKMLWPDPAKLSVLSDHQKEILTIALAKTVAVLSGTPGTGKTYCAAQIIKEIINQHGISSVLVCAPTGKAAVRVQENLANCGVSVEATTVHKLLKLTPDTATSTDDFVNHIDARFIIIDESSMLDASLCAALLRATLPGVHVLFIGDPNQLPPVGHGAPLRDIIESDVVSVGELTEIRRNAGKIVEACKAIKDGKVFEVAAKYNPETGDNLRCVESNNVNDTAAGVVQINGLVPNYGFDPVWDTQVLVAMNARGPLSRIALNTVLQRQLNPNGFTVEGNPYRVGDKVICLKNCKMKLVKLGMSGGASHKAENYDNCIDDGGDGFDGKPEKSEDYIANGEIGRVLAVGNKQTITKFEAPSRVVRILHGAGGRDAGHVPGEEDELGSEPTQEERAEKRSEKESFALAYAITVHKSQGSEFPCAIVVLDPAAKMVCSREHIYTAISRAKKLAVMIGNRKLADEYCKRVAIDKRKTFLKTLLQQQIKPVTVPTTTRI